MSASEQDLHKIHRVLTLLLAEFDRVCADIGVDYALYGGSAIGAIRHQGFIPWDDDIDVMMTRADYERFLCEAPAHLGAGFRIDNQDSNPYYHLLFSKLGLDGTVFISAGERNPRYTPPIFLDIFPLDVVPSEARAFARMKRRTWWWGRLLFLSGIPTPGLPGMAPWKRCLIHAATRSAHLLLRGLHVSPRALYGRWEKAARSHEGEDTGVYADFTMRDPQNWMMSREEFFPVQRVPFGDMLVPVPHDYDAVLRRGYGDYMQVPPPEQRRTHSPEVVSFGAYDQED